MTGGRFSLLILFVYSVGAAAQEVPAPILEKFTENKNLVIQSEVERRQVLGELYKIQRQIRRYSQERGFYEFARQKSQKSVSRITNLIQKMEGKIQRQRERLRDRIRALSKFGGQNLLRMVFSTQNPAELDRQMRYLKIITDRDYSLLKDYRETVAEYQKQQQNLGLESHRLATIQKKFLEREAVLSKHQKEKGELLKKIDADKILHITQLQRLRLESSKNLAEAAQQSGQMTRLKALEAALKPAFFEMRGTLPAPLTGPVVQGFGDFHYQPGALTLRHKGLFISAPKNSAVSAVFGGTVSYAGWIKEYERVVIVSHGDHYFTVYGSLSEIKVKTGDQLKSADEIGRSGVSPFGLGTGAYVEIRHFSEPMNPAEWLNLPSTAAATSSGNIPLPTSARNM